MSPAESSGADPSSAPAGLEERCSPGRFAGAFGALVAVSFFSVVFGGQSFVLRDFGVFGYPLAHYHREAFWAGEIPLWNPLSYAGIPFAGQWNTLVFYPGSLLYLVFPLPWSLNLFGLAHLYLAGLGMYFLVREWTESNVSAAFAGLAFAFGGLVQHSLMWPNNMAALGWLPWVLWTAQLALARGGRMLILAILAGSMQMLTGAPEVILFTWLLAGLLWLAGVEFRQSAARLGMIVAAITGLCAIQLLPFLDLLLVSERAGGLSQNTWAMDFDGWVNFVAPLYETRTKGIGAYYHDSQAWTHSYYVGIAVLWLSLIALFSGGNRRTWVMGGTLLTAMWLAMGADAGLYSLVAKIPPFSMVRYPVKFTIVTSVVFALLAGLGLRALMRGASIRIPTMATACVCLTPLLMIENAGEPGEVSRSIVTTNLVWRLVAGGIVCGLLVQALRAPTLAPRLLPVAVVVLWLDLRLHQPSLHPTIDSEWFRQPNPTLATFSESAQTGATRAHPSKSRQIQNQFSADAPLKEAFLLTRISMFNNWNLVEGVAKINGFYSLWTSEQRQIANALLVDPPHVPRGLADFLGIEFLSPIENAFEWHQRSSARPLVSIGAAPVFAKPEETLAKLTADDFDPAAVVFVSDGSVTAQASPSATVTNVLRWNDEIRLEVNTPVPTMLTVAQSRHPNWQAEIDDQPAEIHRANLGFQALVIPAGKHQVSFRYEDRAFQLGRWLTLAGLLGLAVAWRRLRAGGWKSSN